MTPERQPSHRTHAPLLLQPLDRGAIIEAANAATTPAARLTLALAAIHAARTTDIGRLKLDDIDLGNRNSPSPAEPVPSTTSPTGH